MEERNSRLEALIDLFHGHSAAIRRDSQYLSYGILIGLFHYGKDFCLAHPILFSVTGGGAILSLVLIYIFSLMYCKSSEKILAFYKKMKSPNDNREACNKDWVEEMYVDSRIRAMAVFWLFQLILAISVILFAVTSYHYFFGDWPDCACAKVKSAEVSKTVVAPKAPAENCTPS